MSLDSSFWIDTKQTPAQVQALLVRSGHFVIGSDIPKGKRVFADGVIAVISLGSLYGDQRAALGIAPKLRVYFGCADSALSKDWTLNSVRGVMTMLHAEAGDALFVYSGESPALLRKNGQITIDRRAGLWAEGVTPRVLPLVDLPHVFGEIPLAI